MKDEDGDTVINQSPCPFLQSDNKSAVHDHRPTAYRQYPHTGTNDFKKIWNCTFRIVGITQQCFIFWSRWIRRGHFDTRCI